jgi:hypothetical protein
MRKHIKDTIRNGSGSLACTAAGLLCGAFAAAAALVAPVQLCSGNIAGGLAVAAIGVAGVGLSLVFGIAGRELGGRAYASAASRPKPGSGP